MDWWGGESGCVGSGVGWCSHMVLWGAVWGWVVSGFVGAIEFARKLWN